MSAVVEFVEDTVSSAIDVVSDVGEAVWEAVETVGDIALDAVEAVGDAVVWVGEQVGQIAQAAINDPVGTILKIGAVASGQWWALPLVSAGLVVANGGDIGQAALAAGISLAAQGVAYGVGEALSSAGSGISDMMAADAASMSASGLSASQIADTLASSYGVAADIASTAADLASMGFTAGQIAADLGSTFGSEFAAEVITPSMQNALANIAANTGGSGVRAALSGGDLDDVLAAMGTAGLGTAVSAGTTSGLKDLGAGTKVAGAVGAATGAAAATAASGKDGAQAFLNSLINTTLREAGTQSKAILKQAWDKVTTTVSDYNAQLEKTNAYRETLSPLEKEAKDAEAAVNAELAAYKPIRDKFSDLVTQYDAAKAAGDVALANSLAAQANALVPELNAATEKYNSVYSNYENKLNNYKTGLETYKENIAKTDTLKAAYEKQSIALGDETKKLSEAVAKIEKMPEPVQEAFSQLYKNGDDVDLTLERAMQLSKMDVAAQEGFIKSIRENPNTTNAFDFANKVNAFDVPSKSAFGVALSKGLDSSTAFEVAPVISTFDKTQQNAYTNAVKEGYGSEGADLISAFASLGNSTAPAAPTSPIAPQTRDIASEFVKLAPEDQLYYKELINNPELNKTPQQAMEEVKAARKEFIDEQGRLNILVTGVGQNPTPPAPPVVTPEEKGFFDKYNSLFAFGTPPVGTGPSAVFGPGASGSVNDPFSLFNFGSVGEKEKAIETIDAILADPTTTPQDKIAAESVKTKLKGPAGGGGGGGGAQGTAPSTTSPNTAPTTTIPAAGGSGTTSPSTNVLPDVSFTGTNVSGGGTAATTTAPGTGTTTTTSAGTGGGTGTGTGTGTGSGTGTGTGTGTGSGTGSGSGSGTGSGTGSGVGIGIPAAATGFSSWQALQGQDQYGGIKNLTPGLTQRSDYTLSGLPTDSDEDTVNPMMNIDKFSTGGSANNTYDPFSTKDVSGSGVSGSLVPGLSKAQINYILSGLPGNNVAVPGKAEGGSIEGHNPEFYSEGGLSSMENRYVEGDGDGTSDSVPAMLANGEFVIPADVVSKIGNGSNEAGAGVLDQFLVEIRKHAHSNGEKLPPESKGPLGYLLDAKRKVKA
jgi:hypothetical protein